MTGPDEKSPFLKSVDRFTLLIGLLVSAMGGISLLIPVVLRNFSGSREISIGTEFRPDSAGRFAQVASGPTMSRSRVILLYSGRLRPQEFYVLRRGDTLTESVSLGTDRPLSGTIIDNPLVGRVTGDSLAIDGIKTAGGSLTILGIYARGAAAQSRDVTTVGSRDGQMRDLFLASIPESLIYLAFPLVFGLFGGYWVALAKQSWMDTRNWLRPPPEGN